MKSTESYSVTRARRGKNVRWVRGMGRMITLKSAQKRTPPERRDILIERYNAIKAQNPGSLLFYRMGEFYELFFDDAEIAARALGLDLTKARQGRGARHSPLRRAGPMCRRFRESAHWPGLPRSPSTNQTTSPKQENARPNLSFVESRRGASRAASYVLASSCFDFGPYALSH